MIEKQKGPSIEYPPKPNEPKRFIVQSHARGKSVADWTPIIIRQNGFVSVVPIGKLFPKIRENEYRFPKDSDLEVWTANGWEPVLAIYRHRLETTKLRRIRTSQSLIDVTEDHSLFLAPDLFQGASREERACPAGALGKGSRIELFQEVPNLHAKWSRVDEDLAWLLGLWVAEGSWKRDEKEVEITSTDRALLERAESIVRKYGCHAHIYGDRPRSGGKKKAFKLGFEGLRIFQQFVWQGPHLKRERKARYKIIPPFIFAWPAEARMAFFQGFLAGDGDHGTQPFAFSTSSIALAEGLRVLIADLDLGSGFSVALQGKTLLRCSPIKSEHNRTKDPSTVLEIHDFIKADIAGPKNPNFRHGKCMSQLPFKLYWPLVYSHRRFVYDIETPSHTFVAGVGGVVAHNSNHWDFRFALNDVAEGWTVNANVEGAIEIPIVTLAQLKALHEDQKAWKVDLETGKILPRKVRTTIRGKTRIVVRPGNLFATPKAAVIPKEWMDVEGRTPFPPDWPKTLLEWWDKWPSYVRAELRKAGWDPERARAILDGKEKWEVKEVPVGATRAFPGVFYKFEDGLYTPGARRPWFFEYHVERGKFFQGRLCFRLVTREKVEKSTAWQELVASRFFIVDGPGGAKIVKQVLPPAEAEEEAKLPGFWMFQTPDPPGEIHPYVLSEEAIEKKWLPPRPASALPQKFQKEAPKELRFWTIEDREKALEAREKLAEFFESGAKKSFPVVKLRKGEFKLVAQHWRGPVIIRWGPSASLYHLLIKVGSDRWLIGLDNDPRIREAVAGFSEDMDLWRELWETKERRDVEPGTDLNPTKDTPSWVEPADEGSVEIMEQEAGFLKFKLGGKKLEGLWILTEEEPGAGIWAFTKEEVAPVTKALRAVLQLHSWEGGKEYDLRLERPEGWIWAFHFKKDPREVEDQLAPGNKCYDLTWLEIKEPEKRKVQGVWTRVEPLESGSVVWEEFAPDSIRFALTGMGALSGTWTASLREGGWLLEKLVEKSLPVEIIRKDAKKRVVTGIVLEPGTKDAQGDIIPAEEIEKAAWDFLAKWRYTGLHHEGEPDPRLQVVESWIAPVEFSFPENKKFVVKKGTWLLSVRCPPDVWEKVEKGELRGFSIQGMGKRKRLASSEARKLEVELRR